MTTSAFIQEQADRCEALASGGDGAWSVRLDNASAEERVVLINAHARVMGVLKGRGFKARGTIVHGSDEDDDKGAEYLVLVIV